MVHSPPAADHLDRDRRAHGAADQLLHAGDQPVDVGRLGVERLPAREGQQPVGQRRGPLGRALGRDDVAVEVAEPALRDPRLQQLQAAGDAGQQVVEVVRQAAGELADRLHLLRLAQRLLGLPQRLGLLLLGGDVAAVGVDQVALDGGAATEIQRGVPSLWR